MSSYSESLIEDIFEWYIPNTLELFTPTYWLRSPTSPLTDVQPIVDASLAPYYYGPFGSPTPAGSLEVSYYKRVPKPEPFDPHRFAASRLFPRAPDVESLDSASSSVSSRRSSTRSSASASASSSRSTTLTARAHPLLAPAKPTRDTLITPLASPSGLSALDAYPAEFEKVEECHPGPTFSITVPIGEVFCEVDGVLAADYHLELMGEVVFGDKYIPTINPGTSSTVSGREPLVAARSREFHALHRCAQCGVTGWFFLTEAKKKKRTRERKFCGVTCRDKSVVGRRGRRQRQQVPKVVEYRKKGKQAYHRLDDLVRLWNPAELVKEGEKWWKWWKW